MSSPWSRLWPQTIAKRLEGRPLLREIAANISWLLVDRLLRMGVGLSVGVAVARYLGPQSFGSLSYAVALCALFSAVATLGVDSIVVRELVSEPKVRDEALGTAFVLKLVGAGVAIGLAVAAVGIMRPGDHLALVLVGVTALNMLFHPFDVIDLWFQARVRSKYAVYAKSSAFVAVALGKVVLILMQAPLVAFAIAGTIEVGLSAIGLLLAYRATDGILTAWRVSRAFALRLLRDGWPLVFSSIVVTIYMRIDQVMLGEMVDSTEVGIYAVAVRLAEVWYFIPTAIASSTFPAVISARAQDEAVFYDRLQRLYNLMAFLGYAVALPLTLLAGPLVILLFGDAYERAGPMLALLGWAGLFTNLGIARSSFLTAMNWTRVHLVTVFLGALINVGLNIVLIPRHGGVGAAIATCVSYWFAAHGACFVYPPLFRTGAMLSRAMILPKVW